MLMTPAETAAKSLELNCAAIITAPIGQRRNKLFDSALELSGLAFIGLLDRASVRYRLELAATATGLPASTISSTLDSAMSVHEPARSDYNIDVWCRNILHASQTIQTSALFAAAHCLDQHCQTGQLNRYHVRTRLEAAAAAAGIPDIVARTTLDAAFTGHPGMPVPATMPEAPVGQRRASPTYIATNVSIGTNQGTSEARVTLQHVRTVGCHPAYPNTITLTGGIHLYREWSQQDELKHARNQ
jgi:hypothetical protein